jgi:eukaryotic-like serine/threonine-protein kinase
MQNYIGQQIDRYRITERLGMGGMAVVYKAYDTRLERDVALKLIRTDDVPPSQMVRLMQRFEREAKAQASFSHPNIVPVHDYGDVNGSPYLVMAYIAGGTLKSKTGKPVETQTALSWVMPIADALSYAHKRGVVHRDIKPSNILFDAEGLPVLADFGIAKVLETNEATLTGTGLGIGTPEYMAPEQWHGQTSEASDQYALATVLYELITGKKPYTADTPAAVAIIQATEPLQAPSKWVSDIPPSVEAFLTKALSKSPENRFASMEKLCQALHDLSVNTYESNDSEQNLQSTQKTFLAANNKQMNEAQIGDVLLSNLETNISEKIDTADHKKFPKAILWVGLGLILTAGCLTGAIIGIQDIIKRVPNDWLPFTRPSPQMVALNEENQTSFTIASQEDIEDSIRILSPVVTHTAKPLPTTTKRTTLTPTINAEIAAGSVNENPIDDAEMVFVPYGEFIMGTNASDADENEKPEHPVFVDSFWIYKYEVTNAQYRKCINEGGCEGFMPAFPEDRYPVVKINWYEANAYCEWAGGRLPTEAEWEKAARGNDKRKYLWGDSAPNCDLANYNACGGNIKKIGSAPNGISPYGAMDMAGNVWEWVFDYYSENYFNASYDNPTGASNHTHRMMRGGSYKNNAWYMRVTDRIGTIPGASDEIIGFRCVVPEIP